MNDEMIINFLLSFPGISSLVETRGYPYGRLPQKNGEITAGMPAFTVALWENESSFSIDAAERRDEQRYNPSRAQIDVYGSDGKSVAGLSRSILDVLNGFTGAMSNHTIGVCWKAGASNISRLPEVLLFHRRLDFRIDVMN